MKANSIYYSEYTTWKSLKQRCENKKSKNYKYYGGSGITISKEWADFKTFLTDMGPKPSKGYSLDRIDNAKGYSKENCRWATQKEQMRNTRLKFTCKNGHKRTSENTYHFVKGNRRTCKVCMRLGKQRRKNEISDD